MSRSPLIPIFLTVFVDVLGLTMMLPLLPFYALHFGASALVVTILGASYASCQLVAGPILGRISDRVGRKPVLLVSQMGTFVAFGIIGHAHVYEHTAPMLGLALLFAGRMLDGLTAGNLSIAQAYISDVTAPENRTRAFGIIGISFGMGFLVGPAISGFIAHHYGYAAPAYGAAGLSLLSIVFTIAFLPGKDALEKIRARLGTGDGGPPPPAGERSLAFGRFLSRPLPRRRLLQFFCYTTSFAVLTGGLALFLRERLGFKVDQVGYTFMLSGFMGALLQGALGKLVKRFGESKLALSGFFTMAVGYPLLALVFDWRVLVAVVCFASFGVTVVRPSVTTLITKSVSRREQGEVLGTSQSLASISQMVGQPLAGILIDHHLLWAYALAAGAFALFGAVLTLQPDPAPEPDSMSGAVPEEKASV